MQNSSAVSFSDIYQPTAQLLGADASFGYWHAESFTVTTNDGSSSNNHFAGTLSQITSNNTSVIFPGGASFVPPSLFTLDPTELYLPKGPNFTATDVTLLVSLYNSSSIASSSWSLHIGSYTQKVNGSLVLGGYDPTRVIEEPGAYPDSGVSLIGITLGTSNNSYNWTNSQLGQNFLKGSTLNVSITPSLPYLYLPSSVCSALAETLPITYDASFNVYTWETSNSSYGEIVSSLSYLNFTFSSPNGHNSVSIRVPFALLNLTLDAPLVSNPINYFPCSPTDSGPFALGRAFLQAAFIGQNYNSSTFWLGQAPGPSGLNSSPNIKIINPTDTTLLPSSGGQTWEQSWSGILNASPVAPTSITLPNTNNQSTASTGLANGAIAGIVVGAVCFAVCVIVLAAWIIRRGEKELVMPANLNAMAFDKPKDLPMNTRNSGAPPMLVEAPAMNETSELPTRWQGYTEAPGDEAAVEKGAGHKRDADR